MFQKLLSIFKSKRSIQKMYSELEKVGGLQNAIDIEFEKINSELRVTRDIDLDKIPLTIAIIVHGQKYSQVYIAAEKKLYLPDFWRDGVCLAHGSTPYIDQLAVCINFWLTTNANTKQLADKFTFVTPNSNATFYDEGKEVEYKWNAILNDPYRKELNEFVTLAIQDGVLSSLFPYTSLDTLCFSRCTGYPFSYDTPTVTPISETDRYLVRASDGSEIGSGSANEALKFVLDNLPNDIEPAVKGTWENL